MKMDKKELKETLKEVLEERDKQRKERRKQGIKALSFIFWFVLVATGYYIYFRLDYNESKWFIWAMGAATVILVHKFSNLTNEKEVKNNGRK